MQAIGGRGEDSNTGVKLCQFLGGFQELISFEFTLSVLSCLHGCLLIKMLLIQKQITNGI